MPKCVWSYIFPSCYMVTQGMTQKGAISSQLHATSAPLFKTRRIAWRACLQMLETFSSTYGHRPSCLELAALAKGEEMTPATRLYLTHQSLVSASSAVHATMQGLVQAVSCKDEELITALLVALRAFSYLPEPCKELIEAGFLNLAPQLLVRHFRDMSLPVIVELMWNVLENAPEAMAWLETEASRYRPSPAASTSVTGFPTAEVSQTSTGTNRTATTTQRTATGTATATQGTLGNKTAMEFHKASKIFRRDAHVLHTCNLGPEELGVVTDKPPENDTKNRLLSDVWLPYMPSYNDRPDSPDGEGQDADMPNVVDVMAVNLTKLLADFLSQGFGEQDKEHRNDLIIVAKYLCEISEVRVAFLYAGKSPGFRIRRTASFHEHS